jgi:hypothetical protein
MTREEIQELGKTGRELDALIAEKVMGLKVDYEFDEPRIPSLADRYDEWGYLPNYSTSIEAAWEVVDKVYIHSLRRVVSDGPDKPALWQAFVYADSYLSGIAETAPLAICRAALMAVMK